MTSINPDLNLKKLYYKNFYLLDTTRSSGYLKKKFSPNRTEPDR